MREAKQKEKKRGPLSPPRPASPHTPPGPPPPAPPQQRGLAGMERLYSSQPGGLAKTRESLVMQNKSCVKETGAEDQPQQQRRMSQLRDLGLIELGNAISITKTMSSWGLGKIF